MPCRYEESQEEINARRNKRDELDKMRVAALDRLTHENDMLREFILQLATNDRNLIPNSILEIVEADQIKHRKEDLARLENKFIADKNANRLQKIWNADPYKPLESQLGFDPDDF